MTITIATADPRTLRALEVLATADRWTKAHRKEDGRPFFVIPGSQGRVYWTDTHDCTCPDYQRRGPAVCKHIIAVRLWTAREKARTAQRRPLSPARVAALSAEYAALFPADE